MAIVTPGGQVRVLSKTTTGSGVVTGFVSLQSSAALVSVWVPAVTSGSLVVTVSEVLSESASRLVKTFDTINSATIEPVVWESGALNQNLKITATYTGVMTFEVYVRAVGAVGGSGGGSGFFPSGW